MSQSVAARTWALGSVFGAVGFAAFLTMFEGASLGLATAMLALGAGTLVFCLATMFRMVDALARPQAAGVPRGLNLVGPSSLREEKRRLVRAIRELDFDFEMGKLSRSDYDDVRQTYELRAVEVIRELDDTQAMHHKARELLVANGLVVRDEAEVPSLQSSSSAPEDAEQLVSAKVSDIDEQRSEDTHPNARTCSACGGLNDMDAKFCKHCGKDLHA